MSFLRREQLRCYVFIGFGGEQVEDAEERLEAVWGIGCLPFAQLYQPPGHFIRYPKEWRDLARVWSRPAITKAVHRIAQEGRKDADMATQLVHFDRARQALIEASRLDEVKLIRDQAEALRQYIKQQGASLEMQNHCAEIKLRAERRAGEMLGEVEKNPEAATPFHDERASPPKLAELGRESRLDRHRNTTPLRRGNP